MTFLKVTGLTSRYSSSKGPVYAVDDVDFKLDDGESLELQVRVHVEKVHWDCL